MDELTDCLIVATSDEIADHFFNGSGWSVNRDDARVYSAFEADVLVKHVPNTGLAKVLVVEKHAYDNNFYDN